MKCFRIIILLMTMQYLPACRKGNNIVSPGPTSAVTIINAAVGASPVIADLSGSAPVSIYFSTTPKISYGSFYEFNAPSGSVPLTVYQISDTLNPLFSITNKKNNLLLQPSACYSLFLCGQINPGNTIDTVFTMDVLPFHDITDSSIGIRFINLSPGSDAVGVNIKGQTTGSEASNLTYKSITSYKSYPATHTINSYIFEFRNMATDALLGTYTMSGINNGAGNTSNNSFRFRNFTIVLKGLSGITSGSTAQGTFLVNNY